MDQKTVTATTNTTTTTMADITNNNSDNEMLIINDPSEYAETSSQFDERIGTESEISREFRWLDYYTNDTHYNDVEWRSSPRCTPCCNANEFDIAVAFPEYVDVTQTTLDLSETIIPHVPQASSVMATGGTDHEVDNNDMNNNDDRFENPDFNFNYQQNQLDFSDDYDVYVPLAPPPSPSSNDFIFVCDLSEQSTDYDGDNDEGSEQMLTNGRKRNRRRRLRPLNINRNEQRKWWHIESVTEKCGIIVAVWIFVIWIVIMVLLSIIEKTRNPNSSDDPHNGNDSNSNH
ncbi:uncharacterized protein LOC124496123 [Dermatophagoides farinae]|uniref:uncharacterized protein LOC124496123 n=1 Tax=Dermatophagoides farinae TaxID=6954 RepID=UPI003F5E46A4